MEIKTINSVEAILLGSGRPMRLSELKNILENQPNPMKVFKKLTFDEVKAGLQEFLSPDEEEGSISSEPAVPFDGENKNYSLDTGKSKAKVDQFDDLFKDDNEEKDDLPF